MSRVHFVGGEKGGVGKSVVARALAGLAPEGSVDSTPTSFPVSSFASADPIIERALAEECELVVDLPSRSGPRLLEWWDQSDVSGLCRQGSVELDYWFVTDGGFSSSQFLEQSLPLILQSDRVVLVRNHRWSQDFSDFDQSEAVQRLLARGARQIDFPELDPRLMYTMERHGIDWASARERQGGTVLSPMERRRLLLWWERVTRVLGAARESIQAPRSATVPLPPETPVDADTVDRDADSAPAAIAALPRPPKRPVGTTWKDGASTWTEVGEGCLIHHVRCP